MFLIHEEQLARYGGGAGIRDAGYADAGLLESALGTPRATFGGEFVHEDLFAMAAAYAFHLAQNQAFVDGNKRTGLLAAVVFLDLNGVTVRDPEGRLYDAMIALAERRMDRRGFAGLLRELAEDAPPAHGGYKARRVSLWATRGSRGRRRVPV